MKPAWVGKAVSKGTKFIASAQQPDGGFASYSSPSLIKFHPKITCRTTFGPALILAALGGVDSAESSAVRDKLADWLLAQKSPAWSFNYWAAGAPQRQTMPYPDDLDDTFCALIGLNLHNPEITDETCLGNVVKLLIATENQVGGPYRTWLAPKSAPKIWQDIDLAVNSNIACFLKLTADPLPNLADLMEKAVIAGDLRSPYYPHGYPVAYYLARAYDGEHAGKLADWLLRRRKNGWWGSPLKTALAISALCRLGKRKECGEAVALLTQNQNADGSWAPEGFCLDPSIQNQKHYSGSAALTTALAAEALSLYGSRNQEPSGLAKQDRRPQPDKTQKNLQIKILAITQKELASLGKPLKHHGLRILERIQKGDKNHEVTLLPYFFNESLKSPIPKDPPLLTKLGQANLYGWMAYTVYDDFLDGKGDPKLLPFANIALRASVKRFCYAFDNQTFRRTAEQTFSKIDAANAWELENCRAAVSGKSVIITKLPAYADTLALADRSIGHTLTPLGILTAAGVETNDPRAVAVSRALRHYLAARQLNDDMHDWEQDFQAGIITYVVASILRELAVAPGRHNLSRLLPKMKHQFWHHTLINICGTMSRHTALARRGARSSGLLAEPNIITKLTDKIDKSTAKALEEQAKAQKFLAAYTGRPLGAA